MADKKLNEVQKVTDMAYVPVIMADGSVGQIAKADLVSVVAGSMDVKLKCVKEIVTIDAQSSLNLGVLPYGIYQLQFPSIGRSLTLSIGSYQINEIDTLGFDGLVFSLNLEESDRVCINKDAYANGNLIVQNNTGNSLTFKWIGMALY